MLVMIPTEQWCWQIAQHSQAAIETATGYGPWLHGEVLAARMVLAAKLSERVVGLPAEQARRIRTLIERAGVPTKPPPIAADRWLELMGRDKKTDAGELRFVLLERLGCGRLLTRLARSQVTGILNN
jgi:3-dehydroquinate synthetase